MVWFGFAQKGLFSFPELKLVAVGLQSCLHGADTLTSNDVPSGSEQFSSDAQIPVSAHRGKALLRTDPLTTRG